MSLKQEFHRAVLSCLRRETRPEDLEDWLAGHFQELHDQPDRDLEGAANDVYILIHEHWNQALSAEDFHRELTELVSVPAAD